MKIENIQQAPPITGSPYRVGAQMEMKVIVKLDEQDIKIAIMEFVASRMNQHNHSVNKEHVVLQKIQLGNSTQSSYTLEDFLRLGGRCECLVYNVVPDVIKAQ